MSAGEPAFVFYAAMLAAGAGTVAEVWGGCSAPRAPPGG